jgi:hypothetical protein
MQLNLETGIETQKDAYKRRYLIETHSINTLTYPIKDFV